VRGGGQTTLCLRQEVTGKHGLQMPGPQQCGLASRGLRQPPTRRDVRFACFQRFGPALRLLSALMSERGRVSRWALRAGLGVSLTAAVGAAGCGTSPGAASPGRTASAVPTTASSSPAAPGGRGAVSLSSLFPIGAYVQPASNFALWKSRGVNTVVDVPNGSAETSWNKAAIQDGLYEIRAPAGNPVSDVGDHNLLAWAQSDQPDDITSQVPYTTIQGTYRTWKKIDPKMPVYINFNGQLNQYDVKTRANGMSWYQKYTAGANWITADLYPVNSGEGDNLGLIGQEVTALRQMAGSKPVFVFIESGAYDSGNPVVTADQFRGEVWEAIIHGVRGIFYFPVRVSPTFAFDVTPPAVAAEMTTQDATITKLASVLQGAINPSSLGATASAPLQVAWRSSSGQNYFFVLNLSDTTVNNQKIELRGIGSATSATVYGENRTVTISQDTITDSFGPYAIHIYQIH